VPAAINTGTFGMPLRDAASATINVGQQLGGSTGTALLNTIATGAAAAYVASHATSAIAASPASRGALQAAAAVHGYAIGFWWTAGIFAGGAVLGGCLFRSGPLARQVQAPADRETVATP
jgi:hypothetical protein